MLIIMFVWRQIDQKNWYMINRISQLNFSNQQDEDEWYDKVNEIRRKQRITKYLSWILAFLLAVLFTISVS